MDNNDWIGISDDAKDLVHKMLGIVIVIIKVVVIITIIIIILTIFNI